MLIQIIVNEVPQTCDAEETVGGLLVRMNLPPRRVAVELNRHLVRRAEFDHTPLRDGDILEVVTLVGGG